MIVLGIETSCDETALALVRDGGEILAEVVASQVAAHRPYGGVVPELAARHHVTNLPVLHDELRRRAGWRSESPDLVAVTRGPGLLSALNTGIAWAQGLALAWGVPVIGVNHLDAHYLAAAGPDFPFPHLGLLVSGGHTLLALREDRFRSRLLGETIDDAVGEAYDKAARLLGLGYPGGPEVDRLAATGDPRAIAFSRPRVKGQPYHFSFSGIKTAVRYALQPPPGARLKPGRAAGPPRTEDLCASFQQTVMDTLFATLERAATALRCRRAVFGGGVAANRELRRRALALRDAGWTIGLPDPDHCLDNGTMVARLGYYTWAAGRRQPPLGAPNLRLGE